MQTRRDILFSTSSIGLAGFLPLPVLGDTGSTGDVLDHEIARRDQQVFPERKGVFAGAVLGGLIAFAITRNPVALLEGVVGGAIAGGLAVAAAHYVDGKRRTLGADPELLQNAFLGDHRADVINATGLAKIKDQRQTELTLHLGNSEQILQQYVAARGRPAVNGTGPSDSAVQSALASMHQDILGAKSSVTAIAKSVAKHRDMWGTHREIAVQTGVVDHPHFRAGAVLTEAQWRKQQSTALDHIGASERMLALLGTLGVGQRS